MPMARCLHARVVRLYEYAHRGTAWWRTVEPSAAYRPSRDGSRRSSARSRTGRSVVIPSTPRSRRRRISVVSFTVHGNTRTPSRCASSTRSRVTLPALGDQLRPPIARMARGTEPPTLSTSSPPIHSEAAVPCTSSSIPFAPSRQPRANAASVFPGARLVPVCGGCEQQTADGRNHCTQCRRISVQPLGGTRCARRRSPYHKGNRAPREAVAPVLLYHIPPILRAVVPAVCRLLLKRRHHAQLPRAVTARRYDGPTASIIFRAAPQLDRITSWAGRISWVAGTAVPPPRSVSMRRSAARSPRA